MIELLLRLLAVVIITGAASQYSEGVMERVIEMETIELVIGTISSTSSGATQDLTRPVEFQGEEREDYETESDAIR